jgi:Flp pilus assembly pilin Flp
MKPLHRILLALLRDEKGAVSTEYTVALLLAGLGAATAVSPIGKALLGYYSTIEFTTGLPFP